MELSIIPTLKTLVVGCVDPRVDPLVVLGMQLGDAAIIRNVGGRVTPNLFDTLTLLGTVAKVSGKPIGPGWKLIVLQHTDCGILGCYRHAPELLAPYLGVERGALDSLHVTDPRAAVTFDVAALRADPRTPAGFEISGLVYDVVTKTVETVA